MVVVSISCGLANQMFQYAFALSLKHKGLDIYLDQTNFQPRKEMTCETVILQDIFQNIEIKPMPKGKFKYVWDKSIWGKIMRKLSNLCGYKYIHEPSFGFSPEIESKITKNCILNGHWQSEKYFKIYRNEILLHFTFPPFDEEKNIVIEQKMRMENSVAIHFRKGEDYMRLVTNANICDVAYYKEAVSYIKCHVENPVFYVFTDNPTWVIDNMKDVEYTLVDWNSVRGNKNYRDMQLMSCAKHNIIANSTYSWWAAWLNNNPTKIVIAPSHWIKPIRGFYSRNDIICDEWVKIRANIF